jgi:SAM-dependent methyltransferase
MTDRQTETMRGFGLGDEDMTAWRDSGLGDEGFDAWLTDRVARRPTGTRAREVYGAEEVHDWARRAILDALALEPDDSILDIGCGGGLLLRDAMATGARSTGLDHSPDMVAMARERAPGASVVAGSANALPFPDRAFTAVSMSVVFFFLDDPVGALRECRRVLAPSGRLAVYTTAPELRGTGAAPEPVAKLGHFYEADQLVSLAKQAGFREVRVAIDRGGQLLSGRA